MAAPTEKKGPDQLLVAGALIGVISGSIGLLKAIVDNRDLISTTLDVAGSMALGAYGGLLAAFVLIGVTESFTSDDVKVGIAGGGAIGGAVLMLVLILEEGVKEPNGFVMTIGAVAIGVPLYFIARAQVKSQG